MAGSSSSVSHSESHSDTYIPEYSQTPILNEIAQHARSMSDYVYNWGMERFNKNQGDIDGLMRDALSYASPQRIAVDMGMAEAGVQQGAERGRLSAIKDLESYGIDPSSGRYAALDMSNRVMSAAAAAGAGNQQRMADYAAGNAMRNQAISAGLQNANFGNSVADTANKYLQTGMSLKYPPLGRYSDSVSDSSSGSNTSDPAKDAKSPTDPKQQQDKAPTDPAAKGGAAAKPKPGDDEPPEDPKAQPAGDKWSTGTTPFYNPLGTPTSKQPYQQAYDPNGKVSGLPKMDPNAGTTRMGVGPDGQVPGTAPSQGFPDPNAPKTDQTAGDESAGLNTNKDQTAGDESAGLNTDKQPGDQTAGDESAGLNTDKPVGDQTAGDESAGLNTGPPAETPSGMDQDFNPWANNPDQGEANPAGGVERGDDLPAPAGTAGDGETMVDSGYNPYQDNIQNAAFTDNQGQIDPVTGEQITDNETNTSDPAGSLYGVDPTGGGDWTLDVDQPTAADWGEGATRSLGDEGGGTYDATYDTWTDAGGDQQIAGGTTDDYGDTEGQFEPGGDYGDTEGQFDLSDWGDTDYGDQDYGDQDYGDQDYEDDYGDEGDYEDDYGDEGDYEDDYADEDYADEDYADEDYADEDYADEDYADEDYADEDYADEDYADEGDDYSDDSGDDSGWSDDGGGDDGGGGGDDYARGGPVKKRRRKRRARMATGYGPRPRPRRFARGGGVPPQGIMGKPRMDPPPQAPRPMRGAPMPARGGPRPPPMGRGMGGPGAMAPGNFISPNGMPPPVSGGMARPQRMAGGGQAGRQPEPTQGGFVSRELSPSGGSKVDDVDARLNAGEFVIPKDVATWKGKEWFYKLIAQARKARSSGGQPQKAQTGYGAPR